jgi:transcription termination factor Rho
MMDFQKPSDYKKVRESKYKLDSKDRLSKIIKKKIQTTMIGALSSIEDNFGFLWDSKDGELTKEQKAMKVLYEKVRSEILDRGNTQARNVDAELAQYDIEWLRYSMKIPVVSPNNKE